MPLTPLYGHIPSRLTPFPNRHTSLSLHPPPFTLLDHLTSSAATLLSLSLSPVSSPTLFPRHAFATLLSLLTSLQFLTLHDDDDTPNTIPYLSLSLSLPCLPALRTLNFATSGYLGSSILSQIAQLDHLEELVLAVQSGWGAWQWADLPDFVDQVTSDERGARGSKLERMAVVGGWDVVRVVAAVAGKKGLRFER